MVSCFQISLCAGFAVNSLYRHGDNFHCTISDQKEYSVCQFWPVSTYRQRFYNGSVWLSSSLALQPSFLLASLRAHRRDGNCFCFVFVSLCLFQSCFLCQEVCRKAKQVSIRYFGLVNFCGLLSSPFCVCVIFIVSKMETLFLSLSQAVNVVVRAVVINLQGRKWAVKTALIFLSTYPPTKKSSSVFYTVVVSVCHLRRSTNIHSNVSNDAE